MTEAAAEGSEYTGALKRRGVRIHRRLRGPMTEAAESPRVRGCVFWAPLVAVVDTGRVRLVLVRVLSCGGRGGGQGS